MKNLQWKLRRLLVDESESHFCHAIQNYLKHTQNSSISRNREDEGVQVNGIFKNAASEASKPKNTTKPMW
jgi:hypothetical protein